MSFFLSFFCSFFPFVCLSVSLSFFLLLILVSSYSFLSSFAFPSPSPYPSSCLCSLEVVLRYNSHSQGMVPLNGFRKSQESPWLYSVITHRIHGAAIYGNMDPINIPPMLAYIPAPWILWFMNPKNWFVRSGCKLMWHGFSRESWHSEWTCC